MNKPIYVSGTVGINVLEPPSDSQLKGKVVCMYDVHSADTYCKDLPGVRHLHIDQFLQQLSVCLIIIEEPFIDEPYLTPIFNTRHVKKIKKIHDRIVNICPSDIRLNMLTCSLHYAEKFHQKQTLLHFLAPIMSLYRSNAMIDKLYLKAINQPNNHVFSNSHYEKLAKLKTIKREFYNCVSSLPPREKKQMIYLYKCMQSTMQHFVLLMQDHLDVDFVDLIKSYHRKEREPLNKEYPFNTSYISEYSNDDATTVNMNTQVKDNHNQSNWLYQLEVLIDCTMEMFTVAKLLKEWKLCNVVYMGLVHMARISHWLKEVFKFRDVVHFGDNTDALLPLYLDELKPMDSCVEL